MNPYELFLPGVLVVVVVAIALLSRGAARRGRRYIGTDDAIESYQESVDRNWAPYGYILFFGGRPSFNFMGWRRRVRMQAQLDAERHAEESAKRRHHEQAD